MNIEGEALIYAGTKFANLNTNEINFEICTIKKTE